MFKKIGQLVGKKGESKNEPPEQSVTITQKDLFLDANALNLEELLSEWHWLVPEGYQPFSVSSMGDMFLRSSTDQVFRLDTCQGKFEEIAGSLEEFKKLVNTEAKAYEWFSADSIATLKSKGIIPGADQCYSYKVLPVLGGAIEPDNIVLCNVYVHFGLLGEVHKQVKDLPPGTKIKGIEMKEPG